MLSRNPHGGTLRARMAEVLRNVRFLLLAVLGCAGVIVSACSSLGQPSAGATTPVGPTGTGAGGSPTETASASVDPQASASARPATPPPSAAPEARSTLAASPAADASAIAAVEGDVQPLTGNPGDYDALIQRLARADVVLLGEPSHGTQEVYEERAEITRRLIDEAGFSGVVIEGDWPDAWRVDRYVRGLGEDATTDDALGEFDSFPEWMWRNAVFAELVGWLRDRNGSLPYEAQAGVYGMDLYSLPESIAAVPEELRSFDPTAAARAERRYACAGPSGTMDSHEDGPSCAEHVRAALQHAIEVGEAVGEDAEDADRAFSAVQNARIVVNGRRYALGEGGVNEPSWNTRDRHMAETLWTLRDHLRRTGRTGRLVVWAHNSHIGDARATDVAERGQLNLGQLVREQPDIESALVGFSTYTGTVTAASDWGAPGVVMEVVPALSGSHPELLHGVAEAGPRDFLVFLGPDAPAPLREERLERYIGVIYRPQTERVSHYFATRIADEYDALIHVDETTALEPLDAPLPDDED